MNFKPILIVAGEPNSVFLEIFFKSIKHRKYKSPIILFASEEILKLQMKKLNYKFKINFLDPTKLNNYNLKKNSINLINIDYTQKVPFKKISIKSKNYIKKSFDSALRLIKSGVSDKLINGPISKKYFLDKRFLGITEYLAEKTFSKHFAMLIYTKNLSVCPLTTHLPLKFVTKKLSRKLILEKVKLINKFYKKKFKFIPKIAITSINPHCESISKFNEDDKIIKPAVKILKEQKINLDGPLPADTVFMKENRKKFDVIVGIYHDQVLTPIKTLYEYEAINITLGLPFVRISPDHGPNEKMLGQNLSNPLSLINAIKFLDY